MVNRYVIGWLLFVVTAQVAIGAQYADAQKFYFHQRKACNKCCLELQHRAYQDDIRTGRSMVLAAADPAVDFGLPSNGEAIRIKRFHVPVSTVSTDRAGLEKIGLAILSSGEAICTGTLDCNGGVDGGLRGTNVTVTVRAYAGVAGIDSVADAIVVWENREKAWVWKNRPMSVSFGSQAGNDKLKRFFGEITHIELELEYEIDR